MADHGRGTRRVLPGLRLGAIDGAAVAPCVNVPLEHSVRVSIDRAGNLGVSADDVFRAEDIVDAGRPRGAWRAGHVRCESFLTVPAPP